MSFPHQWPAAEEELFQRVGIYPADKWNRDIVDRYRRNRPVEIRTNRMRGFRHPWEISLVWSAERGEFVAEIQPGYCRDMDVIVRVPASLVSDRTRERLNVPDRPPRGLSVDAWLSEMPLVPIPASRLRAVGTDAEPVMQGAPVDAVPEFFSAQGVHEADRIGVDTDNYTGITALETGAVEYSQTRLLRACDLVLTKPRPTVEPLWESMGLTTQLSMTVMAAGSLNEPATVGIQTKFEPRVQMDGGLAELLATGMVDPPYDQIRLATIYLLSPDHAAVGASPDAGWTGYAAYSDFGFWNLQYDIDRGLDALLAVEPMVFPVPLAGGIAQPVIQAFLQSNAAMENRALAYLNQSRIRGSFWH